MNSRYSPLFLLYDIYLTLYDKKKGLVAELAPLYAQSTWGLGRKGFKLRD